MDVAISPATEADLDDALALFAGYQTFYTGTAQDDERNRGSSRASSAARTPGCCSSRATGTGAPSAWRTSTGRSARRPPPTTCSSTTCFVAEAARGGGVGGRLIEGRARRRARARQHLPQLADALENRTAQRLYERTGAERSAWFEYELPAG
jgi:GNAT superfamily N-acetyltransferase